MKKIILIILIIFSISVSFGDEVDFENFIIVELYDGTLEVRPISMYLNKEINMMSLSANISLVDEAISYAKIDKKIKYASKIQPIYLTDEPFDVNQLDRWRFDFTDVTDSWDQISGVPNEIIIAVLDSGLNLTHPDLNIIEGYDFGNDDNIPEDYSGHGTHVSGIIGAKRDSGTDDVVGLFPNVKLMPVKVFSDSGNGSTANLAFGIRYAVDNGADVINMSLSFSSYDEVVESAINYAEGNNVLVVAASSNDSNHWIGDETFNIDSVLDNNRYSSYVRYPAAYDSVIAVGSVSYDGSGNLGISDFSNISDLDKVLDIVAPGGDIYSSNYQDNNTASKKSGTSMSAPHVTAAVALVKSEYPLLDIDEIRNIIINTAYDSGILIPSGYDRDETIGSGLLNVYRALNFTGLESLDIQEDLNLIDFSTSIFDYDIDVEYDLSEVTLNLNPILDSVLSTSGGAFSLAEGSNNINIESSIYGYSSVYNVDIYRNKPILNDIVFKSGGDILSTEFDVSDLNNTITFSADLDEVEIVPGLKTSGTTFTIDGENVDSKVIQLDIVIKEIVIEVFPISGNTEFSTVYYLYLNKDNGTKLETLKIDSAIIDNFSSSTFDYNIDNFEYDTTSIKLFVEKEITSSRVIYKMNNDEYPNDNSDISGVEIDVELLANEDNILYIKVINDDNVFREYTVSFNRNYVELLSFEVIFENNSTDVILVDEEFVFGESIYDYSFDVSFSVDNINMILTRQHADSTINIKMNEGAYVLYSTDDTSLREMLDLGDNTVIVKIEHGAGDSYQVNVYTVNINRDDGIDLLTLDIEYQNISNETVNSYTEYTFDNNILEYVHDVPNSASDVNITVERENFVDQNIKSRVYTKLNDNIYKEYELDSIILVEELDIGINELLIKIEAGLEGNDDYGLRIFEHTINRKRGDELTDISLKNGDVEMISFDISTLSYEVEVESSVENITFKAVKDHLDEGEMYISYGLVENIQYSSDEEVIIELVYGVNTITLVSAGGSVLETIYTININKTPLSSNADLSTITVSGFSINPSFDENIQSYSFTVSNNIISVNIFATASDVKSSIYIDNELLSNKTISLVVGLNQITIKVIAEDNTEKNYSISITRENEVTNPPSGSSGGSSGGSSSPPPVVTNTPSVPVESDNVISIETILKDLESDAEVIAIVASELSLNEVVLNSDINNALIESDKDVEVIFSNASFIFNSEILNSLDIKTNLTINYEELEYSISDKIAKVFELDIYDGDESIATISVPIPIVLNYEESAIVNKNNLAVYYLDEDTNEWIYVGGKLLDNNNIRFEARHFSKYSIIENAKTFDDIVDHWARDEIEVLASRRIISGISETEFAPERTITNAEFIVLMNKVLALPDSEKLIPYKYVSEEAWYTPYIRSAFETGIITSTYGALMKPEDEITREEMTEILMSAYFYYSGTSEEDMLINTLEFSKDEGLISRMYRDSVRQAYQIGLIVGDNNNNFNPKQNAKRAEAAIVIKKLLVALNLL